MDVEDEREAEEELQPKTPVNVRKKLTTPFKIPFKQD
jgi:hypothetical protein